MNKLIVMIALVSAPLTSFADLLINTKVNCTIQGNREVFSAEIQENKMSHIEIQEYKLWPLNVSGNKVLTISKIGVQGTYAYLSLGDSMSSSVFVSLPLENGGVQNCIVEMTKFKGEKRYIFEL